MTDNTKLNKEVQKEYDELVNELKKNLPNIILPSMGMLDEIGQINIDGKKYIVNNDIKEE